MYDLSKKKSLNKEKKNCVCNVLFTEKGSPGFENFLEILGERIKLKNWDKYRGGLDVKGRYY